MSFYFILLLFLCLHFVDIVLLSFLSCFAMSLALHPGFSSPRRPPPALSYTPITFYCLCYCIDRERYHFGWTFFTHKRFLPYVPSPTFGTTCFYQGLPGSQHFFLKSLQGFIIDLRNAHLAHLLVWITLNSNASCSRQFNFKFHRVFGRVTCGEYFNE